MKDIIGKKYKIVKMNMNGMKMYIIVNVNKKGAWAFFDTFEKANELWEKMEKEI